MITIKNKIRSRGNLFAWYQFLRKEFLGSSGEFLTQKGLIVWEISYHICKTDYWWLSFFHDTAWRGFNELQIERITEYEI